jgi:DNA repair protein RadC
MRQWRSDVFSASLVQGLLFCRARQPAVLTATAVVVAHNHPSGDPTPSEDDIAMTKELIEIGRLHKIPVIDHLVLAKRGADAGTFVSIRNLAVLSFG